MQSVAEIYDKCENMDHFSLNILNVKRKIWAAKSSRPRMFFLITHIISNINDIIA